MFEFNVRTASGMLNYPGWGLFSSCRSWFKLNLDTRMPVVLFNDGRCLSNI